MGRGCLLDAFVDDQRDAVVGALADWLRIPSVAAEPAHERDVALSAEWCAGRLATSGLSSVEVVSTPGHPCVYGEWLEAGSGPTVLVYGHHDVQPADPLDEWDSPPFEARRRGGELFARGASDDKGQVLCHIEAVRGLLEGSGGLPVNVKFLVEGEEEIGSPHFEELLVAGRERFAADVIVVSDTPMWAADVPSVTIAMRGLVAFDVTLRSGERDLHSGQYGGAVPNPAHIAARMVAALHDRDGRVAVPGFYDDVRPLLRAERASFEALGFDEHAWARAAGVRCLDGEAGYSTLERLWARPTCDVTGFHSGYGGSGVKTIVPATAHFKVTFRLVADQDPATISERFGAWVRRTVPKGVGVEVVPAGGVGPAVSDLTHPALGALTRSVTRVWGRQPIFTRSGGSGPEEALSRVLSAPVLHLGLGLPGDRIHAPNERVLLDQLWRGMLAAGELYRELAELS
ncbi:MAG: dipeptidase [Acidimicrobiia bacterium]